MHFDFVRSATPLRLTTVSSQKIMQSEVMEYLILDVNFGLLTKREGGSWRIVKFGRRPLSKFLRVRSSASFGSSFEASSEHEKRVEEVACRWI